MIKYLCLVVLILLLAAVESFGLPWLGLFGLSLPVALVGLAVGSLILPRSWLPVIAIGVGLILDLTSLAPIGLWTLYCLLCVWGFDHLNQASRGQLKRPWWQLIVAVCLAVALAPLYGSVLSQEKVVLDSSLGLQMLTRLAVVAPLAMVSVWLVHRRQAR